MTVVSQLQPADVDMRRPYAPPSNIIAVLKRARSRNLPERIASDFLDLAGVPGRMGSRTTFTLIFLGLTDEHGRPTPALRDMAAAGEPEYREQLAQAIRSAYAADFDRVDPSADSPATIVDAFARYQPRSQTSRMVTTFLGLCREAGIPVLDAPRGREGESADKRQGGQVRPRTRAKIRADSDAHATGERSGNSPRSGAGRPRDESPPLFGVTESDIAALDDAEFAEVWAALGKVARARARSRPGSQDPARAAEMEADETS